MEKQSQYFELKCNICGKKIGNLVSQYPIIYNDKPNISEIQETFNKHKIMCRDCYNKLWRI